MNDYNTNKNNELIILIIKFIINNIYINEELIVGFT